mmetsp:Transcript_49378/g.130178  ORF Transcript_49378/g.130178 Transcript_49378/m.130178 type:complete len:667 (-) Transcript_49378:76-2076(-)
MEELEALRRTREEKIRQIAERRRQVDELRRQRSERDAARLTAARGVAANGETRERIIHENMDRGLDVLISGILGSACDITDVSMEKPLLELQRHKAELDAQPCKADRVLGFAQELSVGKVNIDPRRVQHYSRSAQTEVTSEVLDGHLHLPCSLDAGGRLVKLARRVRTRLAQSRPAAEDDEENGDECTDDNEAVDQMDSLESRLTAGEVEAAELEACKPVEHSSDFQAFFQQTTLLVERTLGQQDWRRANEGFDEEPIVLDQDLLRYVDDYVEDRLVRGRPVMDARFSPHRRELFLASYGRGPPGPASDLDGCMLVWNLAMRSRPEMIFTAPSSVLTADFHCFEPALIYGGTYSGTVVLWDARAQARPVMRSSLSGEGHNHPVQAMKQVGTHNTANLVTASNDGRLCEWSLAMLKTPQATVDLTDPTKGHRDLAMMTLSFPADDTNTNTLYVGAEDGSVCQVHIHGERAGITESYDGHEAPVTGIDLHPKVPFDTLPASVDTSFDLALSCSFDWSVKLWRVKEHKSPILSLDAFEDYVFDVRWHPKHPAVFAAVDGEGHVDLWNMSRNIEKPIVRLESPHRRRLALNRCHWSSDGRHLVTGDSEGTLAVYTASSCLAHPGSEDVADFAERLQTLEPIAPRPPRRERGEKEARRSRSHTPTRTSVKQ